MQFTKMHGLGNDYVYVNCFEEEVNDPSKLAVAVSDRHFSVGSDGLVLIMPSESAAVRMRIFNADGSEAQMCGNGLRCVAKYVYERKLADSEPLKNDTSEIFLREAAGNITELRQMKIETGRGILTVALGIVSECVEMVCVDMGEPILLPGDIPVNVTGSQAVGIPLTIEGKNLLLTAVSMGNPHAVFFVNDVDSINLARFGPLIERHVMFPERTNVHFVEVLGPHEVRVRTWERGSGITLACGTGASAVCVAGVLASKADRAILAHLPGGDLQLLWSEDDNHVYMLGPATEVFEGCWPT